MTLPKKLLLFVTGLLVHALIPAQVLPSLPVDPQVKKGTLNSGITYYIVNNSAEKGFASAALVRLGSAEMSESRAMLDGVSNFTEPAPYDFLARNGVGARKEGYFTADRKATVFHFDNIPVYNSMAADSVLLLCFNIMAASRAEHAIVVAGDVNVDELKNKMGIFSMSLLPRQEDSAAETDSSEFSWRPTGAPLFRHVRVDRDERSYVTVRYRAQRIPFESMNTAQPLVMRNFSDEFGILLRRRLQRSMYERGIPCAGVEYRYISSSSNSRSEWYEITVRTDGEHLREAASALAGELSAIDAGEVSQEEFSGVKTELTIPMLGIERRKVFANEEYVDKCVASYVYGANLAPFNYRAGLFLRRNVADSTEHRLFGSMASAVLDPGANMLVEYGTADDDIDGDALLAEFGFAWQERATAVHETPELEAFLSSFGGDSRVKFKKAATEPVSGGKLWTFSNGMTVVFKKMNTPGTFSYSLFTRGGYNTVEDLRPGEGPFFADLLGTMEVEGLKGYEFDNMLRGGGIEMDAEVGVSGMSLSGTVLSDRLELLLKALIARTAHSSFDPGAVEAYYRDERLRLAARDDSEKAMYDLMYPGYVYSPYKDASMLDDELAQKADMYFQAAFTRMEEGVFVLCGDLDEEQTRKLLMKYLGGFTTGCIGPQSRMIQYQPRSGWSTYTVDGDEPAIHVLLSARLPFTSGNNLAAQMAMIALKKDIVAAVNPYGMSAEVKGDFDKYFQDRFNVVITCTPMEEAGLPASFGTPEVLRAVSGLRSGLESAGRESLPASEMNACKAYVTERMTQSLNEPEYVIDAVVRRYADGKNLIARYKDIGGGITADKVKDILSSLASGSRVEYIVK